MTILTNNLLRVLPQPCLAELRPHLRAVQAASGTILQKQGSDVAFAYFPCDASMISFEVLLPEGKAVETTLVGREGAVGGIVSHGSLPAFAQARVQFSGEFLRIKIADLETLKSSLPHVNGLFARYADCLVAQLFQSAACNATHSIEQRTAKWLLYALDRTGDVDMPLTQEQLAHILGVGRSYMSRVIQRLRVQGILDTRRGRAYVRDMESLTAVSCGCRDEVRHHFDSVLSGVYPRFPFDLGHSDA